MFKRSLFIALLFLLVFSLAGPAVAQEAVPVQPVTAQPVAAPLPPEPFPVLPYNWAAPIAGREGIRAPFPTHPDPSAAGGELMYLYDALPLDESESILANDRRDLSIPHRSESDLANWLMQVIPQSMTFTIADLNARFQANAVNFTQAGLVSYRDYLQNSGYMQRMQRENLRISGFTDLRPILLNEGVAGNVYKWLFDVPLRVSLVSEQASNLRDLKPVTETLMVRLQLTRIQPAGNNILQGESPDVKIDVWVPRAVRGY